MSAGHWYEVLELDTVAFGKMDLSSESAAMVVESKMGATIIVTDPMDVLGGLVSIPEWFRRHGVKRSDDIPEQIMLRSITYAIWALDADSRRVRFQPYRHPFKQACWLGPDWELRTRAVSMFGKFDLADLVDSEAFRGQPAIQFTN